MTEDYRLALFQEPHDEIDDEDIDRCPVCGDDELGRCWVPGSDISAPACGSCGWKGEP